jgi:hypothetical protein
MSNIIWLIARKQNLCVNNRILYVNYIKDSGPALRQGPVLVYLTLKTSAWLHPVICKHKQKYYAQNLPPTLCWRLCFDCDTKL